MFSSPASRAASSTILPVVTSILKISLKTSFVVLEASGNGFYVFKEP